MKKLGLILSLISAALVTNAQWTTSGSKIYLNSSYDFVGIGTTTPTAAIDINTDNAGAGIGIEIADCCDNSLMFRTIRGQSTELSIANGGGTYHHGVLRIYETGSEVIRFAGSRLVPSYFKYTLGVGTTSPNTTYKLHVVGNSYMSGSLFYTGSLIKVSDKRLKTDIDKIDNSLDKILELEPQTYKYTRAIEGINENQKVAGFIAQEFQKTFPGLVNNIDLGEDKSYLGVDYNGLIPYLVAAMQEQHALIQAQATELLELKTQYLAKRGDDDQLEFGSLSHNQPNPSSTKTKIFYDLKRGFTDAKISIHDLKGSTLQEVVINNDSSKFVEVDIANLKAGIYLYVLVVNGQPIDSRKMVVN